MSCKVAYCRYKHTHTTSHHICGLCGIAGHGQTECNNPSKMQKLIPFLNDVLPNGLFCNYCNSTHHRIESHKCSKCGKYHIETECIIQELTLFKERFPDIPHIKFFNEQLMIQNASPGTYTKLYAGMGCWIYVIKPFSFTNSLLSIFMHSDNWGQYGTQINDEPTLNKFIRGLVQIQSNQFIMNPQSISISKKCPICQGDVYSYNLLYLISSIPNPNYNI